MQEELLEVKGLHTSFFTHLGEVKAIRDVSFSVHKSEIVGRVRQRKKRDQPVGYGAFGPSGQGNGGRDPL